MSAGNEITNEKLDWTAYIGTERFEHRISQIQRESTTHYTATFMIEYNMNEGIYVSFPQ